MDRWSDMGQVIISYFTFKSSPSINLLVLFVAFVLSLFLVRLIFRRYRIRVSRDALPFVIGGWGTRGKSGTERKKTALMEALGFNILSKTTGCEATVIHSEPGLDAIEIPLYRPGDKASIWEQEKVAGLARNLNTNMFLWECMALSPDYASIMQHDWMTDDISTLSNTFVDHENVQGPTGMDVTRSLSAFIPSNAILFTAEDSMLPIIRHEAEKKNTRVQALEWHDSELLPDDVLDLYPYQVHPRNLALVLKLARHFGISENFAHGEIAGNTLPDAGAFQKFETVYRSRSLEFWNGMSANDRTSCLSNWRIAGFDESPNPRNEWIVTVINNRDDRVLRSREFSEIIVSDTPAHLHVLIGRNLNGLTGYIKDSIRKHCKSLVLAGDNIMENSMSDPYETIRKKAARILNSFRIDVPCQEAVQVKLSGMLGESFTDDAIKKCVESLIETGDFNGETVAEKLSDSFPGIDTRELPAIVFQLSRDLRDFVRISDFEKDLRHGLELKVQGKSTLNDINLQFRKLVQLIFIDRLYVIRNPYITGDQIIERLVDRTPPNHRIRIMGMQNIKGTGMDFAYRWLSLRKVQNAISDLAGDNQEDRSKAALKLADHDEYGILDAPLALDNLEKAARKHENRDPEIATVLKEAREKINRIHAQKMNALEARPAGRFMASFLRSIEQFLELGDSKRRHRRVKRVWKDLFNQRISHGKAAQILHEINKRQEGGWLLRKWLK